MGYFAAVLTRHDDGWDVNDVDLDGIDDVGDLAQAMRDSSELADADSTFLLFLEQEDAWFAVVRVDGEDDARVFVSDERAVEHSAYAEMLLEGSTPEDALDSIDLDGDAGPAAADEPAVEGSGPVGDHLLLTDLGTDGESLLALCSKEGLLPSEILSTLAENAGAPDALEAFR
ncbi:MAG: tRNA adenosine deaminase-associated protein [Sporichthyaceae bacterium]